MVYTIFINLRDLPNRIENKYSFTINNIEYNIILYNTYTYGVILDGIVYHNITPDSYIYNYDSTIGFSIDKDFNLLFYLK